MKLISFTGMMAGLTLAGLVGSTLAASVDWPQWLGPSRDGSSRESGLLESWPSEGPPLEWKATGLGLGHATVALVGDRIYSGGDRGKESYIVALNRTDGREIWAVKLGKGGAPGWGGFTGVRATPTIDGDLLFAIGQYGEVVCLNARTGKEIWRRHLVDDFGGKVPEWGFSESVLVDGDQAVCTPGGSKGAIAALNKRTGEVIWRSEGFTDEAQYSSLIVAEIGGVRQYLQLTMKSVAGVAADDGRLLWQAPRKGRTAVVTTPIYSDGHVYVSSHYGVGCNLFKITAAGGKFGAKQVYANRVMKNHHGGVLKVGDHLYGYSDGVGWVAQEFEGGEAAWEEKRELKKGSIAYADGHFYLREESKTGSNIALIEATPDGYEEKGRFEQPEPSGVEAWAHPVICDGRLYVRDQDTLFCFDVRKKRS